ncbi:MAG: quinol:cytochrome C oxidoreductase, partial [Cyclobacteriaceae bacterium]
MNTITEENFTFTGGAKRKLSIVAVVGVVLLILGIVMTMNAPAHNGEEGGHASVEAHNTTLDATMAQQQDEHADESGEEHAEEAGGEHHGSPVWLKRFYANLWVNNIYFTGLAIIGVFFIAIQYAAQAGWSAGMKRIPLAMAHWLPIAGVLMLVSWFIVKSDVFHWTHADLYSGAHADQILIG